MKWLNKKKIKTERKKVGKRNDTQVLLLVDVGNDPLHQLALVAGYTLPERGQNLLQRRDGELNELEESYKRKHKQ